VVDPVMVAKGGAKLLDAAADQALRAMLIPIADLVTPNLPEAEHLTGVKIADETGMRAAAAAILAMGAKAVLVKGGHATGAEVVDFLVTPSATTRMTAPRIDSRHTHGTGCTLASAIATGLAQGMKLQAAVERARGFVHEAIRTAPGLGRGHGPLNHGHTLRD